MRVFGRSLQCERGATQICRSSHASISRFFAFPPAHRAVYIPSHNRQRETGRHDGQEPESHHHLRGHRLDPHAVDVAGIPVTASEIADAAIGAAEAGAAVVHLHARDPKDGRPDQSPEAFAPFLKVIKQRCAAVINITTGGAPTMSIEERVKPAATFKPEVATLNMGSMNFGLYPMIPRFKGKFKHAWEEPYLEGSHDRIFKNTFKDIEYILTTCAENGTRFEIECYDIGHLYTLAHFLERGVVKPPVFVQSVFGILGGIGPHPEDVIHMRRTADRLLGRENYHWSVLGAGAQPDADRRDGGRDGRQRARRP